VLLFIFRHEHFGADAGGCVMVHLSAEDHKALQSLEEALWRAEKRFDRAWMDRILAADFFEFGRSGRIYNREQILSFSSDYIDAALPLPEFHARLLSADVAQVTYHSAVTIEGTVHYARRCSIWSRTTDGWRLRFHQGTPYEKQ
jgi:hypothetical protein